MSQQRPRRRARCRDGLAGDVPTLETLAAVDLLRRQIPDLKIGVVDVVDLMTLQPHEEHPHELTDHDFDALFTTDMPVIFAYHGYPMLIHRLTYRRTNHHNIHVRGYKEEGTTTTPFDMVVRKDLDRFHLASDVIVPHLEKGKLAMDRAEFEANLRREGYELREGEIKPNAHRGSHAHEFDARLFVLRDRSRLSLEPIAAPTVRATPVTFRQERCTKNIPRLTACDIWPDVERQQ